MQRFDLKQFNRTSCSRALAFRFSDAYARRRLVLADAGGGANGRGAAAGRGEAASAAARTVHEADLREAEVGQLDVPGRRDQQATRTRHKHKFAYVIVMCYRYVQTSMLSSLMLHNEVKLLCNFYNQRKNALFP